MLRAPLSRWLSLLAVACTLSACGVTDRMGKRMDDNWASDMLFSSEDQVVLTIDGGNALNPNAEGTPLSVVTRVYQLTSLDRFNSADADTLLDHPEQALGNTLLDSRELVVLPGMGEIRRWAMIKEARYITVAAFFRDESGGRWKVAFNADAFRKDGLLFSSEGGRVLLDHNNISAERGVDVLRMPEQAPVALSQPAQETSPGLSERLQEKAIDTVQGSASDAASSAAQRSVDNASTSLKDAFQ